MPILAFDTSSPAVTVALQDDPPRPSDASPGTTAHIVTASTRNAVQRTEIATNRHGELLAPLIEQVLADSATTPADLTAIAVGLGPGPFTGLRVGIMTAKAMGDALGIPVYGECSLDIIAANLGLAAWDDDTDTEHPYVVMTDARRKQVYWAAYDSHGHRTSELELDLPADVAASIEGRFAYVAGAGALLYRNAFAGYSIIERAPYPDAVALAGMVGHKALKRLPSDDLTPLYLRRPDAVPPGAPKQVTPS